MFPSLLLQFLLIPLIFSMPLDSNYNETCDELFERFTKQFDYAINDNQAYKSWAGHLAEKCERIINCDVKHNLSTHEYLSVSTLSMRNYTSEMCYIVDLFNGPVGECMEYIRNEYRQLKLIQCAHEQKEVVNLKSVQKESLGSLMVGRMFEQERTSSCYSLFHNCTRSIMQSDCGSEVMSIIDSNKEFLKHWNCTGFELFSEQELKLFDAAEDMVGDIVARREMDEKKKSDSLDYY